jgi:ubiquitin carboxyl-terminal hydrolase 1
MYIEHAHCQDALTHRSRPLLMLVYFAARTQTQDSIPGVSIFFCFARTSTQNLSTPYISSSDRIYTPSRGVMPSSSSRGTYHYRPPSPHYAQYESNLDLVTVATTVGAAILVVYFALGQYTTIPSPLSAITAMTGLLFGPEYREKLQNTFAKQAQVVRSLTAVKGGTVRGLWNVGNTCYQNSVLQSLASLVTLKTWLKDTDAPTANALVHLVDTLNIISDYKKAETPSSTITQAGGGARGWMYNEQQDAQEFLQGLMGVLEKEVSAGEEQRRREGTVGLEGLLPEKETSVRLPRRSPFEGLLAQRVGCLKCGYVESISLQPFTTLSLPIPSTQRTTLEECIDAFTAIEQIPHVDCDKCTLLSIRDNLQNLLHPVHTEIAPLPLPDAVRETATARLNAINEALDDDNFSPSIPGVKLDGALKVSSTKTKQVMIARAPEVLVLHANRSHFDMFTGAILKNYAAIQFPMLLDLCQLGAVTRHEHLDTRPGNPISPLAFGTGEGEEGVYELKAVVAHFGGHHNGHYVACRKWAQRWWRISDHDVQ